MNISHTSARLVRRLLPAVAVLALSGAAPALADGGRSVASATPVAFGQQQFGNTANGGYYASCGEDHNSYWSLYVTAGDRLVIDWEAQTSGTELRLYSSGVSDFNINDSNPLAERSLSSNNRDELVFNVPRTGVMPLRFSAGCGDATDLGPYDFTAYVAHGLELSFPRVSRLARRSSLRIGVHNPDGVALSDSHLGVAIELRSGNKWQVIGLSAVSNGLANVPVRLARKLRGKRVRIRALAAGSGYRTTISRSVLVRVR